MKRKSDSRSVSALGSPAACLLPQMRARAGARRRFRLRRFDGDARVGSPGAFYTYFSAGALLDTQEERRRRRVVARNPGVAMALAATLAIIWLVFR